MNLHIFSIHKFFQKSIVILSFFAAYAVSCLFPFKVLHSLHCILNALHFLHCIKCIGFYAFNQYIARHASRFINYKTQCSAVTLYWNICIVLYSLCSKHIIHFMQCIGCYVLHYIHCALYAHITLYALQFLNCTLCIVFYALNSTYCVQSIAFYAFWSERLVCAVMELSVHS